VQVCQEVCLVCLVVRVEVRDLLAMPSRSTARSSRPFNAFSSLVSQSVVRLRPISLAIRMRSSPRISCLKALSKKTTLRCKLPSPSQAPLKHSLQRPRHSHNLKLSSLNSHLQRMRMLSSSSSSRQQMPSQPTTTARLTTITTTTGMVETVTAMQEQAPVPAAKNPLFSELRDTESRRGCRERPEGAV